MAQLRPQFSFVKAYIADDDWRVRNELKRLLKAHLEIEVVGERTCADEALEAIENLSPNPLFLDMQCREEMASICWRKFPIYRRLFSTTGVEIVLPIA